MNQRIDLNEEFRQWLSSRLNETLGNDVENCDIVDFDLHQAREDHFWMVYDYIRCHKDTTTKRHNQTFSQKK